MMTIGGTPHILMVLSSIVIGTILFFIIKHSKEKVQNIIIYTLTGICVLGIFYLHGTRYLTELDLKNLLIQMLQVCNFNLILLIVCLFKRNELARQYLFFFSMPMALSTFVSYPSDVEGSMWYSKICLTFWINHFLIVLIPILMIATKRFKPRIEYIFKVVICVFVYFLIAFVGNFILNGWSIEGPHDHSYTMGPGGIMLLVPLYKLIPVPFIYLLPLVPILLIVYFGVARLFKNCSVTGVFGLKLKKRKDCDV